MRPILTPDEAAALDAATQARGIPAATLMERAGHAVARAAVALAGGRYGRRVTVVCGAGNNGGDGFVAARVLHGWGVAVTVVAVGGPATRVPAASARRAAEELGVPVLRLDGDVLARELARSDAAVDAIVGIGFRGPARDAVAAAIVALDAGACPVLAVDVPSGLDAGTGAIAGPVVRADATVTFGSLKTGLVAAPETAGPVDVAEIGFPDDLIPDGCCLVEAGDVADVLPRRDRAAHKREAVVVVIGGSRVMPGAAALAASAAMRGGAGLVQVAVPAGILPVLEVLVPSATFLPLPETADGALAGDDGSLAAALDRAHAVVLGPGAGRDPSTAAWIRATLASLALPTVLDADGLAAFVDAPLSAGAGGLVLTPHVAECRRLLRSDDPRPDSDRIGAARVLAARTGAVALLKGPGTVVATPDGRATVNPTGGPTLATAGSGDVLAGLIGALLARGLAPRDAAVAGAFVHGLAGDRAAASRGDGATAADLADAIPGAFAEVRAA
ncbi:MAG: NAD(P)H-hydrate dehydratase [Actinomycetota bacterium]